MEIANVVFGIIADAHVADLPDQMGRHYREAAGRIERAAALLAREGAQFLVEMGDLKDRGVDEAATLANLDTAARALRAFGGPVYPVLGNHDVDCIDKASFLKGFARALDLKTPPEPHGFHDVGGIRFIRLDCAFFPDGRELSEGDINHRLCTVPPAQLDWLRKTLATAPGPVVAFVHSPVTDDWDTVTTNGAEIRAAFEEAGNVIAVFQAHTHSDALVHMGGIPYCTIRSIAHGDEPDSFPCVLVSIFADGHVSVCGFGGAESRELS